MSKPSRRCGCNAGQFCPLLKVGTALQCTLPEIAGHFGCDPNDAWDRLREWQSGAYHIWSEDRKDIGGLP